MSLPQSYELDPDGDLTLILCDRGDADRAVVNHLKSIVKIPTAQMTARAKGSVSGQTRNITAPKSPNAVAQSSLSEADDHDGREIRLRVSSKHLTLASPVFKVLLCRDFAESGRMNLGLPQEVRLVDDNPAVLWLLLYLVHGQPAHVPTHVNLKVLTQAAILVDKYELHDVSKLMTDRWLENMEIKEVPEDQPSSAELVQLLCASWVFQHSETFATATNLTMLYLEDYLEREGATELPIPNDVLDKVDEARTKAIGVCIAVMQKHLKDCQQATPRCKEAHGFNCDSMVLGSLLKGLTAERLYPLPSYPYVGVKYSILSKLLKTMALPSLCDTLQDMSSERTNSRKPCNIKEHVHQTVQEASGMLKPLHLDDF